MNVPRKVILHCSASPDSGDDIGFNEIDSWHRDRGWSGCGYHFIIRRSGQIEPGRSTDSIGAHTLGHNKNSLGICLVGTKEFTMDQMKSLQIVYNRIKNQFGIKHDNWFCHHQFSQKECPNIPTHVLRFMLSLC